MLNRWSIFGLVLLTAAALQSVDAGRDAGDEGGPPGNAAMSGLRVVMNPATGEIVGQPTADQLGRLGAPPSFARRRSSRDLRRFELPHGAQGVVLDGWAHHTMRVERAADGSFRAVCSLGDEHAEVR